MYEGLVASSPSGEVIPAVAEAWRAEADGKRYIFSLRANARWSNGDPVTADDFVNAFRRAVDPATASHAADLLRPIENAPAILEGLLDTDQLGIRATGKLTLEIRLTRPAPYFPDILTNTVASPIHRSAMNGGNGLTRPGVISNGPYTLAELVPGSGARLVRNPRYWNTGEVAYDEVRYEFVADESAEYLRFRAGALDVTSTVPEQRFRELLDAGARELQHRSTLATFYFTLNTFRGPLRGSRPLREALSLAVDRDTITSAITRAGQVPAYSLVPVGVWNYEPATYPWHAETRDRRLARARSLYASAGYSAERPLRLRMLVNENELVQRVGLAVAAMWKDTLGVETDVVAMEFKAYLAARADPSQWDVVRVGWTADYNDASTFLDTMTRDSPQNFGRWSSADYSRLMQSAAGEPDPTLRSRLLREAEARMLADYPLLPVYFYVSRRLVQPRVDAPEINPMNRTYTRQFQPAA